MKEFGPQGGARPWRPLGSANGVYSPPGGYVQGVGNLPGAGMSTGVITIPGVGMSRGWVLTSSQIHGILWDTVNNWVVRILLECFLVAQCISSKSGYDIV